MALNRSLIAAAAVVLLATTLLISSLEYSSSVITTGSGPSGEYKFVGKDQGPTNYSGGNISGASEHEAEKNGGNATDPFNGLFGREPGNGNSQDDVADSGSTLLIIGIVAAVIATIAFVTFVVIRRHRRKNAANTPAPQPVAAPAQPDLPDSHEGIFRLQFPQIREPFPLTWGVDEPLEMVVVREDGATIDIVLSIDGENSIIRLENGKAAIPLKLKKGSQKVIVGPTGDAVTGSGSWVNVRIVDYREEVVRMFNDLCLRFLPAPGESGYEMTPRELGLSISAQLPEAKQKLLDEAVAAFERANYSLHDIHRADYEVMYMSERGVV